MALISDHFAGDALVKGAVNLALRLGLPALVVSLTVVAFGTSAPELLVSVQAILDGVPGLALGNVVGSNTANVLLVLGVDRDSRGPRDHDRLREAGRRAGHRRDRRVRQLREAGQV